MHEPTILFAILAATLGLFIWGYWRYDVVAGLALMACLVVGAVPLEQAFDGLRNPAVITVACVMIITHAISRAGLIDLIVKRIAPVTQHAILHIGSLTGLAALLSAFMNNVGALALMMPVAIQTAYKSGRSPSSVLMPLALGSALGGLTTAIGTPPNLLIANFRQKVTGYPFVMFDFAPVGVVIAVVGLVYIVFVGWRLLPERRKSAQSTEDLFQIQDYITEISIPENSPIVGKTIYDLENLIEGDTPIIGMVRDQRKRLVFPPGEVLREGDVVIVEASHSDLESLLHEGKLELVGGAEMSTEMLRSDEVAVIEAVVPMGSQVEGRSSRSMRLRTRYHVNLLAISRQGKPFKQRLSRVGLGAGDVIMVQGEADTLRETVVGLGLLPLSERGIAVGVKKGAIVPVIIFALAIACAAMQLLPVQIAFAGAVLGMVVFNVLPARLLYKSIDWPIIVLLAAMIPVGGAMQATGGTDLIAKALVSFTGNQSPMLLLGLLMIVTMALSDMMNNAATAVVMAPIAVSIAQTMQMNIDPFLMAVAVASSCAFLTPIGHQNNVLVMGPGGYKFSDYFRVGIFLDILVLAVGLPMIMWVWPI